MSTSSPVTPVGLRSSASGRGDRGVSLMPDSGPLVDSYGRVHRDLRISVTDRCNLRCVYCMPEDGVGFQPRTKVLSFEEITRLARVSHDVGVTSIRLTGGEPLVRKDIVTLVGQLSVIGFEDIAMTTNAMQLTELAPALAAAGLHRVNISCDSLKPERFEQIRRRGHLDTVLAAMDAAEAADLGPVKVNVVVMAGVNDDEVLDFCLFARETGRQVRFIEYMPLDAARQWYRSQVVPTKELLHRISAQWPLVPCEDRRESSAPAQRFRFADGHGEIGLIASVTQPFCGSCDRLRLTADGAIRNCLFSDDELSARDLLRAGGSDGDVEALLRRAVWGKFPGHGINDPGFLPPVRSMSMIGG